MIYLDNMTVVIDGKRVAKLSVVDDKVLVEKLPACTIGNYFKILSWLDDIKRLS